MKPLAAIRPESPSDGAAIFEVVGAAFGSTREARLVDLIREREQSLISLVAVCAQGITGHVLVSPITLTGASGMACGAVAPLSVRPDAQRQGIGSLLMRAAITRSKIIGLSALFLLGNPAYYSRFGFTRSHIGNEYGAKDAFMHLELEARALVGVPGTAHYVAAFAEVGA